MATPGAGPPTYVCMPGQAYTGSTLLAMLVDTHPDAVSVGAASGPVPSVDVAPYRCSCGERLVDCAFWAKVAARCAELGTPLELGSKPWPTAFRVSRRRSVNALAARSLRSDAANAVRDALLWGRGPVAGRLRRIAAANVDLARAAAEATGASVFVDSSRDPLRPRYLTRFTDLDVRVLHLVRDPRGNVASILRHRPDLDVEVAAAQWRRANTEARRQRRAVPPGRWLSVRYEDLCAAPQVVLDQIHDHLGLAPHRLPDDLGAGEHHVLGNDMRLAGVDAVRLDERWRRALDADQLAAVERTCRPLAEEMGYSWA